MGVPTDFVSPTWTFVLMGAWTLGVFVMGARRTWGWRQLQRAVGEGDPLLGVWRQTCDAFQRRLKMAGSVAVRASEWAQVPMVVGMVRPVILIPTPLVTGMSSRCLEAILAHELMHVRRHDYLVNLLQSTVEALFFYHPTVWWLSHAIRVERELICDEDAAQFLDDKLGYARALVDLEAGRGPALAPAMADVSLKLRVERLLLPPRRSSGWTPWVLAATLVVMTGAMVHAMPATPLASWLPPSVARWSSEIEAAGRRHQVDPNLLAAMVLVESGGDRSHWSKRKLRT